MAVLHARGQMAVGDTMIHESIIGSQFQRTNRRDDIGGGRPAIVPAIKAGPGSPGSIPISSTRTIRTPRAISSPIAGA